MLLTIYIIMSLIPVSAQRPNPDILTSGTNLNWKPPAGCSQFYVHIWASGAGGSGSWGGGGGSFSQSTVYTVNTTSFSTGYFYTVGAAVGAGADGQDTRFANCWAYRGLANGGPGTRYVVGGEIASSQTGGTAGKNYVTCCDNWGGGGGGSAFTYVGGNNGGNADLFKNGGGGSGTANGGGGGLNGGGGGGGTPGGGGGGNGGSGARGEIRIYWTCNSTAGRIGNPHTVPFPAEKPAGTDFITDEETPVGLNLSYKWQSSVDTLIPANRVIIGSATGLTYALPISLSTTTFFRRITNGCDLTKDTSNWVKITVLNGGDEGKNGIIQGRVRSKNGTGVQGITIRIKKQVSLNGSSVDFIKDTITDQFGNYTLNNIFYGDRTYGDPINVNFVVSPIKAGHIFSGSRIVNLSKSPSQVSNIDFTDSTVYSIRGRITKKCLDCMFGYQGSIGTGNVMISAGEGLIPVFSDSLKADSLGYYFTTVENPQEYTFTPTFLNHKFSPASRTLKITRDTIGVNFEDTSTRVISGKLTDVAGKRIGSGTLIFEGIYQRKDSLPIPTFKDSTTIAPGDSSYSVRLPAGNYKVSFLRFKAAYATGDRFIREDSVINFFNIRAVEPMVDISSKDSIRNLVYHRPPVIIVTGLKDTTCNANLAINPGLVFRTNVARQFKVNVYEGPESLGNLVQTTSGSSNVTRPADSIRIFTNVHKREATANAVNLLFRIKNGPGSAMLDTFLLPGAPNTIAPFEKPFEIHYTDRYGRKAAAFKPVRTTVLGVFNPTSTFTTAFPERPYLILHAPPGDESYSLWSKDSSTQLATTMSVAKEDGKDGFVNVSLGPTVSVGAEILGGELSADFAIIAEGSYTREDRINSSTVSELSQTVTISSEVTTNKPEVVTGTSGDVYVGFATNYILGNSIYVDFIEGRANGSCEIEKNEKLFVAPKGFGTEFFYSESHIKNVIIPQQERLAKETTNDSTRNFAENQVAVWKQVIENNVINKRNASFIRNESFSNGVGVRKWEKIANTSTNTITYDVLVGNNIAFELGLRIANVGVSGGAVITMRETTGLSNVSTKALETTMGYFLQDGDAGDYYSVDIKKDPVYGTPVFDLVAGTSSCPPEPGAQNRDQPQLLSGDMQFDDLEINTVKTVNMTLANKSESGEERFYSLSVDPFTSAGLTITSDGVNLKAFPLIIPIPYGTSKDIDIQVEKTVKANNTLSYPEVEFYLTDNCGSLFVPNTTSTAKITFNYKSSCGSITLDAPADGWLVNSGGGNSLPISMSGYTWAGIDSITLQYEKKGTRDWKNGPTVKKAAIDPLSTFFSLPWNTALIKDSVYNLRLRLVCTGGNIVFSNYSAGVIDRTGPRLLGLPQPATQIYNPASSAISFTYDEIIDNNNLNSGVIELRRRSNNTVVPVTVIESEGTLVITPVNSLGNTVDSFRVIVNNIMDLYGNVNAIPDTSFFKLELTPISLYTGTNAATVHLVNPSLPENTVDTIEFHFKLKEAQNKIRKIYFNVSGSALLNTDYKISYDTLTQKICFNNACGSFKISNVLNAFGGLEGYINIDSNQTEAIIYAYPLQDFDLEGIETIQVNLVPGPDYKLKTDSNSVEAKITNASYCPPGNVLYVNSNATGNKLGSSWANAFTSLKDALALNCPNITQIWVSKGTYKPTTNTNRDSTFTMRNNLAIFGGFAGTEASLSERRPAKNTTVLSGDIGGVNNVNDNSYNVIRNNNNGLNATAVLDGFTITGGNANKGTFLGNRGGGVNNYLTSPSFFNCIISGNKAVEYGGGMFNQASTAKLVNTVLAGNTASYGGGLYNEGATTELINCTFAGNQVSTSGGAMYTYGLVSPKVTNSIMWGNSSGIQNAGGATPVVSNSIIQGNTPYLPQDSIFIFKPSPGLNNIGDLRLRPCSPAINMASNTALTGFTLDLAGNNRIALAIADIGAYERQVAAGTIIYVDVTATGRNDGSSWIDAYTSVTNAITDLNQCAAFNMPTSIYLAKGTYTMPLLDPAQLNRVNAIILGGYPNGGGNSIRNAPANPVVLVGNVQVLKSARIDGVRVLKPAF